MSSRRRRNIGGKLNIGSTGTPEADRALMPADAWNPDQYERFREERSRPFFDLLALVKPRPGLRAVDLGCGTGELTRRLHRHINAVETIGVDNSDAMLAKSSEFAGDGLRFEKADIGAWVPQRSFDLVFSNAALHWVPDHEALFSRLTRALAEGGQLAVQMPTNHDHRSHTLAAEIAAEPPFREALEGYRKAVNVLVPESYSVLLHRLGCREQHVRVEVYGHQLASREEVVEWVKGSTLTDYERRLPGEVYAAFLVRYRERLLAELEDDRPYFFPFKRLLIWAQR
jgi:trans-aconitate 2-methyltransferase